LNRLARRPALLNVNLGNDDLGRARQRIGRYLEGFARDGTRIAENLDFEEAGS
jgi:hypothetical protein